MRRGQGIERRKKSQELIVFNCLNHYFREAKPEKFAARELNKNGIHSFTK